MPEHSQVNTHQQSVNLQVWSRLLLIEVIAAIFLVGLLPASWQEPAYPVLYTLIYFTAAFNLEHHRQPILWVATVLLVTQWLSRIFDITILPLASGLLDVFFFGYMVIRIIGQIAGAKAVNERVILEAINGYLLLGLLLSLLISLIASANPGAFVYADGRASGTNDYLYYGFVTYATLGYGDLLPMTSYARSLALLTTIGGQLYLTVIIALLIGKFSSRTAS